MKWPVIGITLICRNNAKISVFITELFLYILSSIINIDSIKICQKPFSEKRIIAVDTTFQWILRRYIMERIGICRSLLMLAASSSHSWLHNVKMVFLVWQFTTSRLQHDSSMQQRAQTVHCKSKHALMVKHALPSSTTYPRYLNGYITKYVHPDTNCFHICQVAFYQYCCQFI